MCLKIRCDRNLKNFAKFFWQLNRASVVVAVAQQKSYSKHATAIFEKTKEIGGVLAPVEKNSPHHIECLDT
jgi:hypothetical protein